METENQLSQEEVDQRFEFAFETLTKMLHLCNNEGDLMTVASVITCMAVGATCDRDDYAATLRRAALTNKRMMPVVCQCFANGEPEVQMD